MDIETAAGQLACGFGQKEWFHSLTIERYHDPTRPPFDQAWPSWIIVLYVNCLHSDIPSAYQGHKVTARVLKPG